MYISKIMLEKQRVPLEDLSRLFQHGHPGHTLAWQVFTDGPDRDRDFIFRSDMRRDRFILWTISEREPKDWGGRLKVETKPYAPELEVGQALGFRVRANPTVAISRDGKRGKRHDVVMHAKHQLSQEERNALDMRAFIREKGREWLEDKASREGFSLEGRPLSVEGYQQHEFKKRPKSRHTVKFSTLDFEGILEVTDPERFRGILYEGLGPAKAYGNGLMLIRPV